MALPVRDRETVDVISFAGSVLRVAGDTRVIATIALIWSQAYLLWWPGTANQAMDHLPYVASVSLPCLLAVAVAPLRGYLMLCAGMVALFHTSPDLFAMWPAAAASLWLAMRNRESPVGRGVAGIGAIVAVATAFVYRRDLAPVLPVMVVIGALGAERARSRWLSLRWELARARQSAKEATARAAWDAERRELARELHDSIGHHVTAMVVQAEAAKFGDATAALAGISDQGRIALSELDRVVVHLRETSEPLRQGTFVEDVLRDELMTPLSATGVDVVIRFESEVRDLPAAVGAAAYRFVQEAVTNVAKHAHAGAVWIRCSIEDGDRLHVAVEDDGRGSAGHPSPGSGLRGIAERAAALEGDWGIGRSAHGGTLIWLELPCRRG